jgi:molybdopterin molybdotransferase
MIPVAAARQRILADLAVISAEQVGLNEALGRVLASDVTSRRTQPPQAVSAMDGYAVRAADVASVPSSLNVIGSAPAGAPFEGTVGEGTAVRIFTGAALPAGADAIVIQEDTERDGDTVIVKESSAAGRYVRPAGLDFSTGDVLLKAGRVLNARDIGLAAAMNVAWLRVRRQPRVALLATGDEIVLPGEDFGPSDIVSSNSFALDGLVRASGGVPITLGIATDDIASIRTLAEGAKGTDILVTTGGASVGEHDLVQEALGDMGLQVDFWQIAMRPGKPLIFGRLGETPMLGFPGNPVSSMVCGALFLKPAIAKMLGMADVEPRLETAILGTDLGENDQREEYMRAVLSHDSGGNRIATPFPVQDSSMFSRMAQADCLLVRPPLAPPAKAGETVSYIALGGGIIGA